MEVLSCEDYSPERFTPKEPLSVEDVQKSRTPITRDGVPVRKGMILHDGVLNALVVVDVDVHDTPREGVFGSYWFDAVVCNLDQHGVVWDNPTTTQQQNLYASARNALARYEEPLR